MAGIGFLNARVAAPPRMPTNPLDKCTIVSIYPFEVLENKPTLTPGEWRVPKGTYDNPSVTVVGPSSWWLQPDPDKPPVEISVSSILIANSVVVDWARCLVEYKEGQCQPGIFIIPGEVTLDQVRKEYKHLLDQANTMQKNWYMALVQLADTFWSRSNGNPRVIGDDMKFAAEQLGLKNKPWLRDFSAITMEPCRACGNMLNPLYPICPTCKAVNNPELATKLGIKFAA